MGAYVNWREHDDAFYGCISVSVNLLSVLVYTSHALFCRFNLIENGDRISYAKYRVYTLSFVKLFKIRLCAWILS